MSPAISFLNFGLLMTRAENRIKRLGNKRQMKKKTIKIIPKH